MATAYEQFVANLSEDDEHFGAWIERQNIPGAPLVLLNLLKDAFNAGYQARYEWEISNYDGE